MKYILSLAFIVAAFIASTYRADAVVCVQAHLFINGETLTAPVMNANPANEITCVNNIDASNIGVVGIRASQIVPQSLAQAIFGGSFGYEFNPNLGSQVPLTISNAASPTADYLDILNSVSTKLATVDSSGNFNVGVTALGSVGGGSQLSGSGLVVGGNIETANGVLSAPSSTTIQMCPNNSCTVTISTGGNIAAANGQVPGCKFSTSSGGACSGGIKMGYFLFTGSSCSAGATCTSIVSVTGASFTSSLTWSCNITEINSPLTGANQFSFTPSSGSAGAVGEFNGSGSTYAAKGFGLCFGL